MARTGSFPQPDSNPAFALRAGNPVVVLRNNGRHKGQNQRARPHTSEQLSIAEIGCLKQIRSSRRNRPRNTARLTPSLTSFTRRSPMMSEPASSFAKSEAGLGQRVVGFDYFLGDNRNEPA